MLPPDNRLTDKYYYEKAKKYGKSCSTPFFVLSVMRNIKNPSAKPKIGFIVSNKIDKRAVVRHKLKRVFSDIVYKLLGGFKAGYYYIFIIRFKGLTATYEEISSQINKVLSEISFL
ncbi:MAG: ribonuclease P protein component [Patescibacteria group bacterium]